MLVKRQQRTICYKKPKEVKNVQVFEIGKYTIAAENTNDAFAQYLEESNYLDDAFVDELNQKNL